MRVIPVLDLKGGQVVRGVAGKRQSYRPIDTPLAASAAPRDVAIGLVERFLCSELYVADLDAIAGAACAWSEYESVLDSGAALWLDAGVCSAKRAEQLAEFAAQHRRGGGVESIILGLESLPSPNALAQIAASVDAGKLAFSLDLRDGRLMTESPPWRRLSEEEIVQAVVAVGIKRVIVLDVAHVGTGRGPATLEILSRLREKRSDVELVSGGGVRGLEDLALLAEAGCDAALVASALHDGRLSPQDVAAAQRW